MKKIILLSLMCIVTINLFGQEVQNDTLWKIDSIQIKKNWRTRKKIILRELQFNAGETIDRNCLESSINNIWNIGNFAMVDYSLDSISPGGYLLDLTAKDAFTFLPILSFSGSKKDYSLSLGVKDNNFLGRNITLDLQGNFGTYRNSYNIGIKIPRQLLYKNMTLSFQVSDGTGNNYRYAKKERISVVAYQQKQFSGSIGNPFHTDYHYTFSPNLSWSIFQHKTDSSLISSEVPFAGNYEVNYLALSFGESIGMINHRRHQKEGYVISAGFGLGLGLDKNSPFYKSFGFGASYYKLFNRIIEFSSGFSSGYTTATLPSLIHYLGPGNIKGMITGEESGQGYFSGNVSGSFTYIDHDWFALEHTVSVNYGKAGDDYFAMFKNLPRISVGTGFKIWTPMIPWLAASVHFSYLKGSNNWFHLAI